MVAHYSRISLAVGFAERWSKLEIVYPPHGLGSQWRATAYVLRRTSVAHGASGNPAGRLRGNTFGLPLTPHAMRFLLPSSMISFPSTWPFAAFPPSRFSDCRSPPAPCSAGGGHSAGTLSRKVQASMAEMASSSPNPFDNVSPTSCCFKTVGLGLKLRPPVLEGPSATVATALELKFVRMPKSRRALPDESRRPS